MRYKKLKIRDLAIWPLKVMAKFWHINMYRPVVAKREEKQFCYFVQKLIIN